MCDDPATSREHVPPRCFFPKSIHSSGKNFRKNLITVPACEAHNSQKSKDDEYLLYLISSNYENNQEGLRHFLIKTRRSFERHPNLLRDFFFRDELFPIQVDGQPSLAFSFDPLRFENAFNCMARAIYFHYFKTKWDEQLQIIVASGFVTPTQGDFQKQNAWLQKLKSADFGTPKYGENQEIFYCQFLEDENHILRLRMVFYEGFVVYAVPIKLLSSLRNANN